jgi:hypothetical protein
MDRVAHIEHIAAQGKHWEKYGLVHALVRCLSSEDAVTLFLRSVEVSTSARTGAIRKVCSDIVSGRLVDPTAVITTLMTRVGDCEPRRRESVAYCLLEIARACDSALRRQVQEFLGASRYIGLRRRSYKLYVEEDGESRALLERAWRQHHDYEAAWLIVKTFSIPFLVDEKNALLKSLTEGWQLSRLYLRLAEAVPEPLDELLALDPISYIYVVAKRGIRPPIETVNQVLDLSLGDERLGLLLWSIGELGLWDVLDSLSHRLESIDDAQRARFLKKFPDKLPIN